MDDDEYFPSAVGNLQPCRICGRTFNPETLRRHEGICQKNTVKKRKTFNSQKQRSVPDGPTGATAQKKSTRTSEIGASKKGNWKQKHEEFIQTIRAARGITKAIKEGKELPPPPPPTINPDYIQCPYCSRRFNEHAVERHIKFCADQHKRLETRTKAKTAATMRAAEKQERRTAYRPPGISSGLRRTVNLSNGSPGYSSSASSQARSQPKSTKKASAVKMAERSNTDVTKSRFNDNSTFDTTLPASAVATTRTGLKARILISNSSSDIDYSDHDTPRHSRVRQNPTASKPSDYQDYYQSNPKTRLNGSNPTSNKPTRYDWDFSFEDSSPELLKQNGVRKVANSRTRQQSFGHRNGGYPSSSTKSSGRQYSDSTRAYEDSLNDFVAREFGSKHKPSTGHHNNGNGAYEMFSDDGYKGQGEPAHIRSKDPSFASDGGRDNFREQKNSSTLRFCHECGSRYPVATAKFCCECGMKRIFM